jgi:peptidoglycan-N-acetylglucosamine deacetylase
MTPAPGRAGRANAFTVDVEEWFHICGVGGPLARSNWASLPSRVVLTTRLLLEELDRARVRATFFVLGWVAERHPALVAEIAAAGHEIGSHGYAHERAWALGPDAFRQDLRLSVRTLGAAGAGPVTAFRAPEWSINDRSPWALAILAREGFTADASMAPLPMVGSRAFPRTPHRRETEAGAIGEYPPLVADRFGQTMPLGWGWGLRMSSPTRVVREIAAVNARGAAAVLMVHPWELDPDPPRVPLPLKLRFAHYFRLDGFRARLRTVLQATEFGALGDLPPLPRDAPDARVLATRGDTGGAAVRG